MLYNNPIEDFLMHAALRFETDRIRGKVTVSGRNKWFKDLAKAAVKHKRNVDPTVWELCKTIRSFAGNAAWVFDQWFQVIFAYRPTADCHPLSMEMVDNYIELQELDREDFLKSRGHLTKKEVQNVQHRSVAC